MGVVIGWFQAILKKGNNSKREIISKKGLDNNSK